MKVKVTEIFEDRLTGATHQIGDVLEVKDAKRVEELVNAKVVEVAEAPKETTKKATSKK